MLHYIKLHPDNPAALEQHTAKMLGDTPYFHPSTMIVDSHIGSWTEIGANTMIAESVIGDYTYTAGDNSIIYADIGKFCSIASHVRVNPGNHPMGRVTQHHMTYRRAMYGFGEDDKAFFDWRREHRCIIGHDVWIGHAAIVMPGVQIGTGAVIGSGAVVTKNIAPYEIAVGVPARPIRKRFSDDVIAKLMAIAWWDWDHDTLKARIDEMNDLEHFVERYG
ncbi:MAG: acetyltransferase [Phototrophicales bacterium]|nr:MAG: acetyltransferase [Phototrophicales bacterium]